MNTGERQHRAELDRLFGTPPGWGRLSAVNHSVVGLRMMLAAFAFFLFGGLLAMLMRAQLAVPDNPFLDHQAYSQIFTMHGTVMMFLFTIPFIEGMALYFIPKFLGSRDLSFPRLSAFGYWCFLFGGALLVGALLLGVAPNTGWFMYTPLSSGDYSPGINADVWLIGVTFVEISAIVFGVELVATVLKVRTAGMSLSKMPLIGWYILAVALMMIIGFPPLILASVLLEIERAFQWPFFDPTRGGDAVLWAHLFWLFGHPEVYIIFLPGAAVVTMMIPTFARRRIVGYNWVVGSIVATGFISFGIWAHHMFTIGIPHLALIFFSAASMLVVLPTTVQFFVWLATLWKGRPVPALPMLYLFGFLFIFVAGGLTGVMLALVPFNWQAHDTHFVVAHLHYVLIGGFVFPLLAALYYWLPLLTGRDGFRRLGSWAFWLLFIGFNVTFGVMHLTGLVGMPRRVYTYAAGYGWEWLNLVSSIGGFVLTAGFAVLIIDVLLRVLAGRRTAPNPWHAGTLEWGMAHPPPNYNIASQPEVIGRDPLWDQPGLTEKIDQGRGYLAEPRHGWRETLGVEPVTGRPDQILLLPGPSFIPLATALALAVFFVSFLLSHYALSAAGALLALICALRWAWMSGLDRDYPPQPAGCGLELPLHPQCIDAPGWWGMVGGLAVDATFYITLLFGYLYLWAAAPGWPPPAFIDTGAALPAATAVLALGSAWAFHRAVAVNAVNGGGAGTWLLAALSLGAAAGAACLTQAFTGLPAPQTHAYAAVTAFVLGYCALHCLLTAVLACYAWLRRRAGYVSAARSLDLRVGRLWAHYSAAITLIALGLVHGFPWLLGAGR